MKKTRIETVFSRAALRDDILKESRSINIPEGFAESVSDKVSKDIEKWLDNRPVITKKSYDMAVVRELKKYNKDLAYLFENRGKIL